MNFKCQSLVAASLMTRLFRRALRPPLQHSRHQAWGLLVDRPGTRR
ncbi:hypothetical protein ROSA5918_10900 [Roseateles saccharophilus]|uniref:Uncharacterized protein n=1 Tax=Roseateles saccharophilus TaxID=304 RepID=A0A4V6P2M5_ROSSA|nr:hypothetical protein [Roseateles saccharophilus]TCU95369.1 hypothetical protein EV671_101561 [Roseateles saccharophilus]